VWVARLKSFSDTAEKLHTTQAAVSHRIATLERELGVRLFERDTREVRLTPQGRNAIDYAEHIVRSAAEFRRRVGDPTAISGRIRIGVIDTIAFSWLSCLIDRVSHTYPHVTLELDNNISIVIAQEVLAGHLDLGLLMGPIEGPGVVNMELCTFGCVWVANPRLAGTLGGGAIEVTDLVRFPILSFPRGSKPHEEMIHYFGGIDQEEVRLHTAFLATLIRLACDGLGIAALPAAAIQRELKEGSLTALDVRPPLPSLQCHAVYQDTDCQPLPGLLAALAVDIANSYCQTAKPQLAWRPAMSDFYGDGSAF
jgi:DNA-binding transcriptional LysR family regulator